ncbi:hypothetical protein [Williamsia serinedens]|uniref:Uncharacterized protein n=1 Tax=Williamsia serinedens TaxID=391736 RepID=A0ABT1GYS7_9NOCA|nr:hypothetical protein [Williamsia serinedens]MCP2160144.1 hypothetical protein [Williamsia serinedens]
MSLTLLGLAAAWIPCSVATALVVARGICIAERAERHAADEVTARR